MTFPRYPEYKDSGVEWLGEVPAHWQVRRLRYVAELNPSKSEARPLHQNTPVSFIPMEAVGDDGRIFLEQDRPICDVLQGYTYVREGDVTIAKITPCFENGKGAVMRGLTNRVGFGSTELTVLRPRSGLTTSDYLYRVVSSEPFRVLGESSMYGAGGQQRVPDRFFRNFAIAWPPFKEQAKIQAFLDHETARIDALVEEQQRLIALLKEKRQAVISHAVTKGLDPNVPMKDSGVEWLGEVPEHWRVSRLKQIVKVKGGSTPTKERLEFWDGHIPWVSPKDMKQDRIIDSHDRITDKALSESGLSMINPGAVLVVVRGMILAHSVPVAIAEAPLTINQDMKAVTPCDDLSSEYMLLLLSGIKDAIFSFIDSSAHGTKKLEWERFENIKLPFPALSEQRSICRNVNKQVDRIHKLIGVSTSAIELLQERRSALISAAVTGKIDVRGWEPPAETPTASNVVEAESA